MTISSADVQKLREMTGVGMMTCKKAMEEADGDLDKAVDILRKSGAAKAAKRADREVKEGVVASYIHSNNKLGVLVELLCETDFVARTEDFQTLAKDIAMQIAATDPQCVSPDEVSAEQVEKEKEIYRAQLEQEGKPADKIDMIIEGKVKKFREENALLTQPFVKDPSKKVEDLIKEAVAKIGENIKIGHFARILI